MRSCAPPAGKIVGAHKSGNGKCSADRSGSTSGPPEANQRALDHFQSTAAFTIPKGLDFTAQGREAHPGFVLALAPIYAEGVAYPAA